MIHVIEQVPALFTPLQIKILQDNAGVINVTYTKLFINLLSEKMDIPGFKHENLEWNCRLP